MLTKLNSKVRIAQGFKAIKMNATEDIAWLDSPNVLDSTIERVRIVKKLGLDVGLDFHGRLHRPMAKQLVKLLEAERPLFVEEPILSENPEAVKSVYDITSIPIALGERLYSRWDVKPFLEARCIDILQPGQSRGTVLCIAVADSHCRHQSYRWRFGDNACGSHGGGIRCCFGSALSSGSNCPRSKLPDRCGMCELRNPGDECRHTL